MQLPNAFAIRCVTQGTARRRHTQLLSILEILKFFQTLRKKSSLRTYLMRRPRGVIPASSIRMSAMPPGRHCGDGRRQARLFSSLEIQKFFQILKKKSILRTYLIRRPRGVIPASSIRMSAMPPGRHRGDGRRQAFCRRAGSAGIARWRSSGSVNSESRSVS